MSDKCCEKRIDADDGPCAGCPNYLGRALMRQSELVREFPPAPAMRAVPIEATARLKKLNFIHWETSQALREVIEFVEQFESRLLPNLLVEAVIAGSLNEIALVDPSIEARSVDLIRLNGRCFAPEIIEVVDDPRVLIIAANGEELTLEAVEKVIETLEGNNPTPDGVGDAVRLVRHMAEAMRLPAKRLDEDDLEQIISDSVDIDWRPRDAARAVFAELYGKGEE